MTKDSARMTKDSARKKEIRARQAQTGEAYNAARRALDQDPAAGVGQQDGPQIAERDWWRHALVRVVRDVTTGSPYADRPAHYRAGRVLTLWQTGRKGRPIDTTWTTSLDVDLMGVVPADAVELVEVLEELPPGLTDPVEPLPARLARRWARASAVFASAASAAGDAMTPADRVMMHDHRQQITRDVRDQVTRLHRGGGHPDPELLHLAAGILEEVVRPGASGYQWDVDGARAAAAGLRELAADPQGAPDPAARLRAADAALGTALQVDGTVGVDARLDPREREAAAIRFGARLAAAEAALPGGNRTEC